MELTLADLLKVTGLPIVVAIITNLAKPNLPEVQVPRFAVAVGIAIAVAVSLVLGQTGPEAVAQSILTGLLGGAASVGLYKLQEPIGLLKSRAELTK